LEGLPLVYQQYFERNYGILTPDEQNRVKDARVVIVGCGGIGGVIALALARSGLEHFVLYEHDSYQPSNMNRQIECFTDTLGMNKVEVIHQAMLKVNPEIQAEIHPRALQADEIDKAVQQGNVIIPAADEWPLSINMIDRTIDLGKPAIMAYPVGALARVSTFLPGGPYGSECLVMPYRASYQTLKTFMDDPANRQILQYYQTAGGWRQEWFDDWCQDQKPHAQLCTPVWVTGALAAMEVIKLVCGKWKPVTAPRYWHITPSDARIARFSLARRMLSRATQYPWGQNLLPALAKRPRLVRLFTRAIG
jgi:molybdopterin/thiamine biosynthesis adenylyltransferase